VLERVIANSPAWLCHGGVLLLEVGGDQSEWVAARAKAHGFVRSEVLTDAEDDVRAVIAQWG
jgi:methylase of polypeptide subunit release factors